jgi:hypothetical protein
VRHVDTESRRLRDALLAPSSEMTAVYHDEKPHLMVVIYDPERVKSVEFVNAA